MTKELDSLRDTLDKLDQEWVELLAQRFKVTERVGLLKRSYDLPSRDTEREREQYRRITEHAIVAGLDPGLAEQILRLIIESVVKDHDRLKSSTS